MKESGKNESGHFQARGQDRLATELEVHSRMRIRHGAGPDIEM